MRPLLSAFFLVAALTRSGESQQPVASLATGVGNAFGMVGARGDVFVVRERMSVGVGAGIFPGNYNGSHVAGAAALRYYYVSPAQHRLFLEASWSVLARGGPDCLDCPEYFGYGPGLSLGYAFLSTRGPTVMVGVGLGRDLRFDETMPMFQLGIGWTWRRRAQS